MEKSNIASFNQIIYTFYGDTLNNYTINYLKFEKDMTRRPANFIKEGDITFTVGYTKNTNVNSYKKILPTSSKNFADSCDLVSKVRYYLVNSVPDSSKEFRNKEPYKFYKLKNQLKKTKWVSNHDRYYFSYSTLQDSTHLITQQTNANDHVIEWGSINPYFSFWIGLNMVGSFKLNQESVIRLRFNNVSKYNSETGIKKPLIVETILPQPTNKDINEIVYTGDELKEVITQKGIYVSGVDPIKKEEMNRDNMKNTVLFGTFVAILFDIFIQLILKWRKLRKNSQQNHRNGKTNY